MHRSIRNFNIPPWETPLAFELFEDCLVQIPPSPPGPKLCSNALPLSAGFDCQMPHPKNKWF